MIQLPSGPVGACHLPNVARCQILHRENVTEFDCVIDLLLKSIDTAVLHPHVTRRTHPSARADCRAARGRQAQYPVVDTRVLLDKLDTIERTLGPEGDAEIPRHMMCSLPFHRGES